MFSIHRHNPDKSWFGNAVEFAKELFERYTSQRTFTFGASLAYYTLFSIAPIITIILASVGDLTDSNQIQAHIFNQLSSLFGESTAESLNELVTDVRFSEIKSLASIISLGALLITATAVVNELKVTLNWIWNIKEDPRNSIIGYLKNRLLSLSFIVGFGFLLLVTLVVSSVIMIFSDQIERLLPEAGEIFFYIVSMLISLSITSAIFFLLFRVLPDARVHWKDLLVGAIFTAILFAIGKYLIGIYIGNNAKISAFGAAAAYAALLLWVYYSSQIIIIGAQFTYVWAKRSGRPILPDERAVKMVIEEQEVKLTQEEKRIQNKES